MPRTLLILLFFVGYLVPSVQAGQFLTVTRSANGAWSLQDVESISVNGKEKLRTTPLAPGPAATWDSKSIGRLAEVQLSSFAIVRRTPDGAIIARTGDTNGWQVLLPESTNSKTAD
jgi:hypothetical protein